MGTAHPCVTTRLLLLNPKLKMLDLRAAPMCVSNTRAYTAFPFRTRAFPFPAHFPLLDRYHSAQAHIECRAELGSVCIAHTIYDAFLALTRALQRSACRDGRRDHAHRSKDELAAFARRASELLLGRVVELVVLQTASAASRCTHPNPPVGH